MSKTQKGNSTKNSRGYKNSLSKPLFIIPRACAAQTTICGKLHPQLFFRRERELSNLHPPSKRRYQKALSEQGTSHGCNAPRLITKKWWRRGGDALNKTKVLRRKNARRGPAEECRRPFSPFQNICPPVNTMAAVDKQQKQSQHGCFPTNYKLHTTIRKNILVPKIEAVYQSYMCKQQTAFVAETTRQVGKHARLSLQSAPRTTVSIKVK